MSDTDKTQEAPEAPVVKCKHAPHRLHSWFATDKTLCVACCDCGSVLAGGA